jgi:hypothetical protein
LSSYMEGTADLTDNQTPEQTPIFRNKEPRSDKLLSDQDLRIGTVGFVAKHCEHRRRRAQHHPRPPVAKHTEAAQQPQVHPIVTQGDGKNDILSVFRGIPGVGAALLRHSCRNMPYFTDPKTDPNAPHRTWLLVAGCCLLTERRKGL